VFGEYNSVVPSEGKTRTLRRTIMNNVKRGNEKNKKKKVTKVCCKLDYNV
jgi:hypothetical protein